MHNLASIYRFNTPFLNIENEKNHLLEIKNKIKLFLSQDIWEIIENAWVKWGYHIFSLQDKENILSVQFHYISDFSDMYYIPIFKMEIYMQHSFLLENTSKQKLTLFLTSLFECFDWLNEKEYLIDIDKNIYYQKWLLKTKYFPQHNFSDLDIISKNFETKKWEKLLQDFILHFKNKNFILNSETSGYYHKIHSIFLYYIYLVYIMYQSILQAQKWLNNLDTIDYDSKHIELMRKRLEYVNDLSIINFKKYYARLEIFFNLFKNDF